ncbi:MAG: ribosome silencing factor [Verrucomicrobia bacterium]|nr:ribosome silencing factor [Verrucomicrobiota bacterium]MCH8528289.1 ribosome silencing factor [Kiritimatiellia bacterium]
MTNFPTSLVVSVNVLRERLADDIRILNVHDVSTVTSYFLLATASGIPHIRALTDELDGECKSNKIRHRRKGGSPESGWMVMDFGNVVVHIMTREHREFYALEQLWSDAKTVDPAEVAPE